MSGCYGISKGQVWAMSLSIALTGGILVVETLHLVATLYFKYKS